MLYFTAKGVIELLEVEEVVYSYVKLALVPLNYIRGLWRG